MVTKTIEARIIFGLLSFWDFFIPIPVVPNHGAHQLPPCAVVLIFIPRSRLDWEPREMFLGFLPYVVPAKAGIQCFKSVQSERSVTRRSQSVVLPYCNSFAYCLSLVI